VIDFGHGVALGPLDSEHLEQARRWRNNYEIRRWCRQNALISDFDQGQWYERQAKDPSIKMYSILKLYGEEKIRWYIIGVCGLTSIDLWNRRAEFSIYIGPENKGQGLGAKALKTLVDHGFSDLNLNTIWGETVGENPAQKMFEKIGFQKEGTRKEFYFKNGEYRDSHLYSLQFKRWQQVSESWKK
jgi:RimJ/RimL family protein N-acetyltransferase